MSVMSEPNLPLTANELREFLRGVGLGESGDKHSDDLPPSLAEKLRAQTEEHFRIKRELALLGALLERGQRASELLEYLRVNNPAFRDTTVTDIEVIIGGLIAAGQIEHCDVKAGGGLQICVNGRTRLLAESKAS